MATAGQDPQGRLARAQERLTAAAARAKEEAEAARGRWAAVDVAFAAHERDRRVVGGVLAGAIAFRLFVYLLPLFLSVVTVLGIVVGFSEDVSDDLGDDLGLSRAVIESVATASQQSHRSLWILVPLTLWAIFTAGLGAAKVLHAVHTVAWDRPIERLQKSLLAPLVTFGLALVVATTVAGTQALRERSDGLGLGFALVQVVILIGVWLVASLLLPHDPAASWQHLLPGAVLVGVGFWLLHLVSAYLLVHRIASASELYGSLGVAAALLAWLYVLGRLMVGSAMLNSTLWERRGS